MTRIDLPQLVAHRIGAASAQIIAILVLLASLAHGSSALADEASLALLPGTSTLTGTHAIQQLVVESVVDSHFAADRTAAAKFTTSDEHIATVDASGVVHPVGNGTATITATIDGQSATSRFTVAGMEHDPVRSFRNDVQPLLAKMGCSLGACHGALAGKGGFKLSLRGYDAVADFEAITRAAGGRRIEPSDPGRSLVLLKPTMAVPHKGGLRFDTDSPAYAILSQWIAAGAAPPAEGDPRIDRLEVFPHEVTLHPKDRQRIVVRAKYSDGHTSDVTRWAKFSATNEAVAGVSDDGRITCSGHGGGAVSVWYSSKIINVRITSPYDTQVPATVFAEAKRRNFIDELVLKQLAVLNLPPAQPADDATFIRRAFVDTIGKLPTVDEVRAFLGDGAPDKRDRLIEALLAR